MVDSLRKQQLEDYFFLGTLLPDNLTKEDREYINALSKQWNYALLNLYGQIMKADKPSKDIIE